MNDAAMIDRLEAVAAWFVSTPSPAHDPQAANDIRALLLERERLVALLGDAEGALEPFAITPENWPHKRIPTNEDDQRLVTVLQRIKDALR